MATTRAREDISAVMRRVQSRNTAPELQFRRQLWRAGVRYRLQDSRLPGKPDIVFSSKRLAVFVDGDYWHGNQWRRRNLTCLEDQFQATESKTYWLGKIRRNMQRDCEVTTELLKQGWHVFRVWESQITRGLEACVEQVVDYLQSVSVRFSDSVLCEKTFAEFFAGIGLMRMGLERAGWNIRFANDFDSQKQTMYEGHFRDSADHFCLEDVHTLDPDAVPTVTLATASFPCNDLSLAGSRLGLAGTHSSAYWGFTRILDSMSSRRPPLVLLENVTGFLNSRGGNDIRDALLELNRLGYAVDMFVLDAARFVPQSRRRLFIVGQMHDKGVSQCARSLKLLESDVRPKAVAEFIFSHPEIVWDIRTLPHQPNRCTSLQEIIEDLNDTAPEWWSHDRATYLLNQMSARHRAEAEKMIAGDEYSYGTVFRRVRRSGSMAELRTDGLAGCLRTPRGGSGRQILFKAGRGDYAARLMTPRECARLMGADDYTINVPCNSALFGFGDAVCVPAIEWIAIHYLNPLINERIRGRVLSPQV